VTDGENEGGDCSVMRWYA